MSKNEATDAVIRVCVAGATGWVGSVLVPAIAAADDLALGSAVARSVAGQDIGTVLGGEPLGVTVTASVADALEGVDVLVDYTSHDSVKANALAALERGVAVVIGSSGLSADDFAETRSGGTSCGRGRDRRGQLLDHGGHGAGRRTAGRPSPAACRDHRLRERRKGRCAERDGPRTGRASGGRAPHPV